MKNLTRKVLLAALLSASPFTLAQTDPNADIYGRWKIKEMIGGGAASALSQRDVNKLIGKFVTINAKRFSFNGRTCAHPTYQRRQEETVNFFDWAWRTDVSDIPFPNPVTVIETGCNTLFPIRKNHLMIAEENVFLEAVRVPPALHIPASPSKP